MQVVIFLKDPSNMNKVNKIYVFLVLTFFSTIALAGNWYEGGTLHKSNIPSWKAATYENKLATASDWALMSPSVKSTVQNSGSIDTAKTFANELVTCIDTSTESVKLSSSTTEIVASCMALMGWLK